MKQFIVFALLISTLKLAAQTRLSLYEEFSGEQCFPCAVANPGLQSLVNSNASNVVLLSYPVAKPLAGPLYNNYKNLSNARVAYYSIHDAPVGRLNGIKLGSGSSSAIAGHVSNLTQSDLDSQKANAPAFTLSLSHTWSSDGDSIFIQMNVAAVAAFAQPGAALRLRLALVNDLSFTTAPGINGERDFPNVVQEMYPNPNGTILNNIWAASQSTSFTVSGKVAGLIDKQTARVVAWLQNDADKSVLQVAVSSASPMALDAAITAARPIQKLQCGLNQASIPSATVLRNAGTVPLTSARIFYHGYGGPSAYYDWTGTLAPGSATTILLPPVMVGTGNQLLTDSVTAPNGKKDYNAANNVVSSMINVYNTAIDKLPVANGFEGLYGATPAGWLLYDADSNGRNFQISRNIFGGNAGYGNSTYFLLHNNYYVPSGETNLAILPAAKLPDGPKSLEFALAHAPYDAEQDRLDVLYSTNCGASWTNVWSGVGSGLTATAATTDFFVPTAADWELKTVDMSTVPDGAIIAFRAVSDFGNALYMDNIKLSAPLSIAPAPIISGSYIAPQPARDKALLHFTLSKNSWLSMALFDMSGRLVWTSPELRFGQGAQVYPLPIANLSPGVYQIRMNVEGTLSSQKLVVAP
ncbi:MAG: T9SS type A sorting domain-containing protein [Bacteroidetes bacterium]|nr:T9SS type A sorting domain-containing protein [Bacteroidota bacterium]